MKLFEFFSILFFSGSVLGQDFLFSDEIEENKNDRSRTSVLRSNPRRISQLKCDEFKELTEEINIFGSFSLIDDDKQADVTSTCSSTAGLVVGGEDAKPNEFPHMAALGYRERKDKTSFNCGGSLISASFVLTAAHCGSPSEPVLVRLGNYNLKHKDHVDIDVSRFIRHPKYSNVTRENDIALIELKRKAKFSDSIRPACVHQTEHIDDVKVVATGWGFTSYKGLSSDILQKVGLDILDNSKCQKGSNRMFRSQICSGVVSVAGAPEKDTCNGDSGGPLQIKTDNTCVFDIVGIVSYGSTSCGSAPGIYTRVSSFIDWIERTVWPFGV